MYRYQIKKGKLLIKFIKTYEILLIDETITIK